MTIDLTIKTTIHSSITFMMIDLSDRCCSINKEQIFIFASLHFFPLPHLSQEPLRTSRGLSLSLARHRGHRRFLLHSCPTR